MSQHNIVGSEAFETERHVRIRAYRRHVKRWRGYLIAAGLAERKEIRQIFLARDLDHTPGFYAVISLASPEGWKDEHRLTEGSIRIALAVYQVEISFSWRLETEPDAIPHPERCIRAEPFRDKFRNTGVILDRYSRSPVVRARRTQTPKGDTQLVNVSARGRHGLTSKISDFLSSSTFRRTGFDEFFRNDLPGGFLRHNWNAEQKQ